MLITVTHFLSGLRAEIPRNIDLEAKWNRLINDVNLNRLSFLDKLFDRSSFYIKFRLVMINHWLL